MFQNKTVAVLLQGPSLKQLERCIEKYQHKDWLWASLNHFYIPENNILRKIQKKFDIVYCSSPVRTKENLKLITEYLSRHESNYFITNSEMDFAYRFSEKFPQKIIIENFGVGFNSLFALIVALARRKVKKIILFGADGGTTQQDVYYKQEQARPDDFENRKKTIALDMWCLNRAYQIVMECLQLNAKVVNCSPETKLTCFEVISHDDL